MSHTVSRLTAVAVATAGLAAGVAQAAPATDHHAPARPSAGHHRGLHATDGRGARQAANVRAARALLVGSFVRRQPRTYAERYIDASTYVQHNPQFGNGREAFIKGVEGFLAQTPAIQRTITRTIAEGDLVVVEGAVKTGPTDRGTVIVDTFRFNAAGKIVEHWDAIQPVAASSANGNPQV